METTLRSILDSFEASSFFRALKNRTVRIDAVFIIFTDEITYEDLYEDLSQGVADLDWKDGDELWPKHAVRYQRAGIPAEQLADIYDMKPEAMKRLLYQQRNEEARRLQANQKLSIELLRPDNPKTPVYLHALSGLQIAVYNHPSVRYIWLEWAGSGEAGYYLAPYLNEEGKVLNTYDAQREVVVLRRRKKTKQVQFYEGAFKLQEMPEGQLARFRVNVPVDGKLQTWKTGAPPPPVAHSQLLSFPVKRDTRRY